VKAIQNTIIFILLTGILAYAIVTKLGEKEAIHIDRVEKIEYENINIEMPDEFFFCGDEVPLTEPDILERLDRELHSNVFFHSHTFLVMKRANRWFPQMEKILKKHGLPEDLKYLVVAESSLSNVVSPAKAVGFWQILKVTGEQYGLEINDEVDERYDPIKSTEVACRYFKQAYKDLGNWTLVAASYNRGISGIKRALKKQRVDSYYDLALNSETARYVFRAMAFKEVFENRRKYKFNPERRHLYEEEPTRRMEVTESIPDLVDFAMQQGITYKELILHNPWLRSYSLTIKKPGASYMLKIPLNSNNPENQIIEQELDVQEEETS